MKKLACLLLCLLFSMSIIIQDLFARGGGGKGHSGKSSSSKSSAGKSSGGKSKNSGKRSTSKSSTTTRSISKSRDTHVKGYTKKDGTYVSPHRRTTPDSTKNNNWSTKGNVNPYTGKPGTKEPYK